MPKVSVIVPIFGVEEYIERCAVSLLEQTLEDIEYIFVNDCTTDRSMEILEEVITRYPKRNPQIKIINLPINSGLPTVRKVGLQYATGEYIAHCDSDDWVSISAYKDLYEAAIRSNVDIVFCDYYKSDGNNHKNITRKFNLTSSRDVLESVFKQAAWNVWSALVKRSVYQENIIFPTENNGEDFALMFQLIFNAKSFAKLDAPLYYYYYNQLSITNAPTESAYLKRYCQLVANTELVLEFLKRNQSIHKYSDLLLGYKLYCRTKISCLTGQAKYRQLWMSTYPELSFISVMTNSMIPLRSKLHYITVLLRLYNILRR